VSDQIGGGDLTRIDDVVLTDVQDVFETRRAIFGLKLSSKFAPQRTERRRQAGHLVSGWLVRLAGRHRRRHGGGEPDRSRPDRTPWRDLVAFYRTASTVRVKYTMLLPAIVSRG